MLRLFGVLTLLMMCSGYSHALPRSPETTYLPLATCNNQGITLFQAFVAGTSTEPAEGLVTVASGVLDNPMPQALTVKNLRGSFAKGLAFESRNFGTVSIDSRGRGRLNYKACRQARIGEVTCVDKSLDLECKFLPIPPSGFSIGN